MVLATLAAVRRSKCGSTHSTEFSRSFPDTRRASGVRTIRPRSWVMWVSSLAGRKDTSTSARGQSQPVEIASLREQHADVGTALHRLGRDMQDREPSDLDRGVIAEHVRHRVRFDLPPVFPNGGECRSEKFA